MWCIYKVFPLLNECGDPPFLFNSKFKFPSGNQPIGKVCLKIYVQFYFGGRKNYGLANNVTCIFCQNPDSIEHAFLDCRATTSFLKMIFSNSDTSMGQKKIPDGNRTHGLPDTRMLLHGLIKNQAHGSDLHFSSKEITFNDIAGTSASQVLS